jgi:hypothetical protein
MKAYHIILTQIMPSTGCSIACFRSSEVKLTISPPLIDKPCLQSSLDLIRSDVRLLDAEKVI